MNVKRNMGVCRAFLISCRTAAAGGGVLWLVINAVYALDIASIPEDMRQHVYNGSTPDAVTPWILLAAGMITYHRFWGICASSSVSPEKQTAWLGGLSLAFSALYACADIVFAKGVLERVYGGLVFVHFEDGGNFFHGFIRDRLWEAGGITAELSYPPQILLALVCVTALYYYSFFLSGCFIMGCIDSGRIKRSVYYIITGVFGTLLVLPTDKWGMSPVMTIYGLFSVVSGIAGAFSSPAAVSYWAAKLFVNKLFTYLIISLIFIVVTLISIWCVVGDTGEIDRERQRRQISWKKIRAIIKRFAGTLRLTALSAEYSAAAVIILWIAVNFGYAVYLGHEIHASHYDSFNIWRYFFSDKLHLYSDMATPFILIIAVGLMIPRQTRLCAANSVSGRLQAAGGLVFGGVLSCLLAWADIFFSKAVISEICGAVRYTFLEKVIYGIVYYDESSLADPYSREAMSLLGITALYYLTVFMTAYFYGRCFHSRARAFVRYVLIDTIAAAVLLVGIYFSGTYGTAAGFAILMLLMAACSLASPHLVLLIILPESSYMDSGLAIMFLTTACAVYLLAVTVLAMDTRQEISDKNNRTRRG